MEAATPTKTVSKAARVTGWILTIVPVLLLVMSGVMKILKPEGVVKGFEHMQVPIELATGIGILQLAITGIYLVRRTSVLGAILLTGYLGGAILTGLRVGDPWIFPLLVGVALWGGLWLRDHRVRALIPLKAG